MSFSLKSWRVAALKIMSRILCAVPLSIGLGLATMLGCIGYAVLPKKRQVVYANLKTVFSSTKSPQQISRLTLRVFINFAKSFVELLCFPRIKKLGFERFVNLKGKENIDAALAKGRGVIFLAVHSGSWELASMVGSMTGNTYNIVANEQPKAQELDDLLNDYRRMAGAKVIAAGVATKEIIRSLNNNEIVSLALDLGGKEGVPVEFFGKSASMSTGAIRLGLKYGCAVCPVWIERIGNGQTLTVFEPLNLESTDDVERDIVTNTQKATLFFERLIRQNPREYLWFYKVYKYSKHAHVVICDDGRTGHLRQSQAVAAVLASVLKNKGKKVSESTVLIQFKSKLFQQWFAFYSFYAQGISFLRKESLLRFFVTEKSYQALVSLKADYVVSCGSQGAGVNYILSKNHLARSVAILQPGLLSHDRFDLNILPEHDLKRGESGSNFVFTKVAPNLIEPVYLKNQGTGLLNHFSHLKSSVRTRIGVLVGGNTKGVVFEESKMRQLINHLKDAAAHFNAEILITTSRRTPPDIDQLIVKELKGHERCALCIVANQHNVPEAVGGILSLSDVLIVSGESISMVSECLSSGKKTIVFSPMGDYLDVGRNKYERFVIKLNEEGYLIATSIKDVPSNLTRLLSQKVFLKTLEDRKRLADAVEAVLV